MPVLEENTAALVENTAAIKALIASMGGKTPAAAAPAGRGPGRPRKVAFADVKAIAEKVKEDKGRPAAVALIKEHGADSLADLPEAKYAEFIAAAEVVLSDDGGEAGGEADL